MPDSLLGDGQSDSERIYREALELIDRDGCETFTHGRCLDEHSGRRRGADYGADAWCQPCIARDALDAGLALLPHRRPGLERERMPLNGGRLWRWKLAIWIYQLGCRVSGRHEHLLRYDEAWREWYCPRCGWLPDDGD